MLDDSRKDLAIDVGVEGSSIDGGEEISYEDLFPSINLSEDTGSDEEYKDSVVISKDEDSLLLEEVDIQNSSDDFMDEEEQDETVEDDLEVLDGISELDADVEYGLDVLDESSELDSGVEDDSDVLDENSELKFKNILIKLDVWLEFHVKNQFIESFLKYKSLKPALSKDKNIDQIISNFELEEVLDYKYHLDLQVIEDALHEILKPASVLDIVNIAKKYDVEIKLTKNELIRNFLNKYKPYEVLSIFNDENIRFIKNYKIPVLEQIYILSDTRLDELSKSLCPTVEEDRYSKITCITSKYAQGYLISNNEFKGVRR